LLADLDRRAAEYGDAEAVVLAISSDPLEELLALASDRFGERWAAWSSDRLHALPSADEIGNWLEFMEVQCRECEAPEWRDSTND
jgi:hypothetical protein